MANGITGKELIMYILKNNLENEVVIGAGFFFDFLTEEKVAAKFDVGVATVRLWRNLGMIPSYVIGDRLYYPKDVKDPREGKHNE